MLSEEQTGIFKALSDQNRLKIVNALSGGEMCACKILEMLNVSQPTLSHHMGVLVRSGLVIGRKSGQWMHYSLNQEAIDALTEGLEQISDAVSRNRDLTPDKDC